MQFLYSFLDPKNGKDCNHLLFCAKSRISDSKFHVEWGIWSDFDLVVEDIICVTGCVQKVYNDQN